jgi:hypothetical protein
MDADSGNRSQVEQVKNQERGQDIEVDVEKSQPVVAEKCTQSNNSDIEDGKNDRLPFSTARSILFVISLTGASFLNVRIQSIALYAVS